MLNNDILRRLRYALSLNDKAMIEIFALGETPVSREQILQWLKKEHEEGFVSLPNTQMRAFLDGLITYKRGKLERETPPLALSPAASKSLSNNTILKKLRIALAFKEEEMLNSFQLANFKLSRGELSAFFRQKGHKHHRECGDQVLRNFLQGITLYFRQPIE